MADNRIITALDVHSLEDMKKMVITLGDSVTFYKVGMELFYSVGPDTIRCLRDMGKKCFSISRFMISPIRRLRPCGP